MAGRWGRCQIPGPIHRIVRREPPPIEVSGREVLRPIVAMNRSFDPVDAVERANIAKGGVNPIFSVCAQAYRNI